VRGGRESRKREKRVRRQGQYNVKQPSSKTG
jgi:hypothetical protein